MKISKIGQVPIERLFATIRQSLKDDFQQNTGSILQDQDIIQGLTYTKTFGDKGQHSVKVTVEEFTAPYCYAVCFHSNRGKEHVRYQLEDLGNDQTNIEYSYEMEAGDIFVKGNQFLMEKIFSKSIKRQTNAQLEALIRCSVEPVSV
ncbi:TPA: DUF3284 domain-containing protein [Streptococcus suis]|uniref:DUF3284 domain-containing protein n=7 Tax=Streptococcus suis TaxID=1307 RepID=A0A0H3N276_STRS4|nr:DUF3284 domain-containing protein [Streptococcus suis]ABP91038.1 hypothetical protein SSU05_2072 [Streptococcus suis 05ZYH33]ABP93233.1 hypothetical protein SSU98_2075 [Streptococcus suis 98HAH33]MCY0530755.1 DUF3284 domain-containing protein [Klebsiella pneumoniae]ADE32338.1 hypothetical protein SSGZ1_1882 [Streptococcus suis GZ1]ADV71074.1 hypothetical protein SSUJS14_2026 [Streptococcus suis JS14]